MGNQAQYEAEHRFRKIPVDILVGIFYFTLKFKWWRHNLRRRFGLVNIFDWLSTKASSWYWSPYYRGRDK